ncbi:MAG: SGNH/GDSL hydrolase family protein [Adhaeribacter sp.]
MLLFRKIFLFLVFTLVSLSLRQETFAQTLQKFEKEITAFEQADKANPPKKNSIVFTGSSSIRLWNDLTEYFPGKTILNRGFGGSQTDEVVYYADRIVTPYKPKQVVIYSGDNDIASGKSPEKVLADFKTLFSRIRAASPKATVTYISIKPSPSRKQHLPNINQANALIKDFLAKEKRTAYVDVYNPMLLPSGKPKPELFRADSLHMTKAGYDIWAQVLKPYLK